MPFSSAPIRVVLADDDPAARGDTADLLASLGHTVLATAASAREAVAATCALRPDILLLDLCIGPGAAAVDAADEIARAMPSAVVVLFSDDPKCRLRDHEVKALGSAFTIMSWPMPAGVLDAALRLAAARGRALFEARLAADAARRELEHRKLIERAKGILMRRTGSSEQEAYSILRRSSQDRSVPMVDIARAVLESEPSMTMR